MKDYGNTQQSGIGFKELWLLAQFVGFYSFLGWLVLLIPVWMMHYLLGAFVEIVLGKHIRKWNPDLGPFNLTETNAWIGDRILDSYLWPWHFLKSLFPPSVYTIELIMELPTAMLWLLPGVVPYFMLIGLLILLRRP